MVGVRADPIDYWTELTNRFTGTLAVYPPVSSPSPTPSLGLGGTSSQAGELFPPSPPVGPGGGLSISELESFKMGKSVFSRSVWLTKTRTAQEKYRCQGTVELAMPMTTYRAFHEGMYRIFGPRALAQVTSCSLSSLLPQHHISLVDLAVPQEERRPLGCADDITIASSMLGQPPSKFDASNEGESRVNEEDLEADLSAIWSKAGCDEFEIILQDGIDESKALLFPGESVPDNLQSSY